MVRLQRSSTLACQLCLASLRPPPVTRLPSRALSTSLPRRSPSSTPPTSPIQSQLTSLLTTLNLSARSRARAFSSALAALELQRKLGEVGGKINQATGYEEIERLRVGVGSRGESTRMRAWRGEREDGTDVVVRLAERALLEVRERATVAKRAYGVAVALRAASQKEVNDLLQRKSSWTGSDVMRSVLSSPAESTPGLTCPTDSQSLCSRIMRMRRMRHGQRKRWIWARRELRRVSLVRAFSSSSSPFTNAVLRSDAGHPRAISRGAGLER